MDVSPVEARRALLHPVWLGSLALLVLNDHLLKGAGVLPGWLTGKLSDVVGMLVAPALLACLLRVRSGRGWALSHVAIGVVFAAINVFPQAARGFEALTSLTPLPWLITVDPTDLVVLPMLAVSFVVLGRAMREPAARAQPLILRSAALTAGTLACMGTSSPPPCDTEECPAPTPVEPASLTIGNTTNQQRLVRVRPLAATMIVDCEALLADPTASTHRDMFEPAEAWLLEPGRALPLNARHQTGCEAFLIDAQGLPMTLVAWSASEFPQQTLPTSVERAGDAPGRMIMMRQEDSELGLDAHLAVFDAPAEDPYEPEPACAVPDETVGIAWSELPVGMQNLVSISSSPDGCHDIELESDSFYVCLPLSELPFQIGELLRVSPASVTGQLGESPATASGILIEGQSHAIRAMAGSATLSPDPNAAYDISVDTQPGCLPHHDACANYVTPLEVTFLGNGITSLRAGESAQRTADGSTLYMVRAQQMSLRNSACESFDVALDSDMYFESVLVTPLATEE